MSSWWWPAMEILTHLVFRRVAVSTIGLSGIAVARLVDQVGGAAREHLGPNLRHHQEVDVVHDVDAVNKKINNDSFSWNLVSDDGANYNTKVLNNTGNDHHTACQLQMLSIIVAISLAKVFQKNINRK